MLKNNEKILFSLFMGIILETKTSEFYASMILIIPSLQYFSFQFDNDIWFGLGYLNQRFIDLAIKFFGLFRISVLFRLSGLGNSWKALPILIVFGSTFGCFIVFIFFYFEIKSCQNYNSKLGYEFEFSEMSNYEDTRLTFQKKPIVGTSSHTQIEEKGKAMFFKTQHNAKVYILKYYNLLLPMLILPFMEVYMENIENLMTNYNDISTIIYGVLSVCGVIVFLLQIYLNTLLFNNYAFDTTNNINRNTRFSDLLWPFCNVISPIIGFCLKNVSYYYYINSVTQFLLISYLLIVYINNNSFFNPQINELFGTCLIFRLFIVCIFILCSVLNDFPCFLIIFTSLAIKFSLNLSKLISTEVTNNINFKSFYSKEIENDFLDRKFKDFFCFNSKFIAFFSNFYFLKQSVKPTFYQIIEEIPLCFIGYFREHINMCKKQNCPFLRTGNKTNSINSDSASFIKRLALNVEWQNKQQLKINLSKYISETYRQEANIMNGARNETKFLYILFLLFEHKGIIRSILTLNSLYMSPLSFHERYIMYGLREFMCKYMKMIEEKTLMKSKERDILDKKEHNKKIKKDETRFESSIFVELEKNFNLLKQNIELYTIELKALIKELTMEKVTIASIEGIGKRLLNKFDDIRNGFLRANKNVRFIKIYRDFITIFKEDEWELRRDLTKLLHLINQVEENYEQAESNQGGGGFTLTDETHFFNEKSCFLYVSGLEKNIGRIIKTDENMAELFGYNNSNAMTGLSIDDLMPKIFANKHSSIVLSFLETGETIFIYRENRLFGLNKKGFTFPLNITVKPYLNRTNYSLEFLAHIKPTSNRKETLILADDLGNIDCFGEALDEIFEKFYEKNRGQKVPIQVLIPDLMDFFQATSNAFIDENKELLAKNKKERSVRNKYGSSAQTYKSYRSFMNSPRKRTIKMTQRKEPIDIANLFNNFIKNEFGDIIVQIIIKDNYPLYPTALNMDTLEEGLILNYLQNVKSLVHTNEAPCDVYRIDISIESRNFSEISVNILHVRRFKHLYRNNKNDSIEKVLKRLKKNTITLLPKILKQTGFLRVRRRVNEMHKKKIGYKSDEEIKKVPKIEKTPIIKRRRNSDITNCPQLVIEEINSEDIMPINEIDRNILVEEIKREKENIKQQNSLQENLSSDRSLNPISKNMDEFHNKTLIVKKQKNKFPKKIKTQCDSPQKEFLKPPVHQKDPLVLLKETTDKKLLNIFSRSLSSISNINKREDQRFYADEGRHLYKIQSRENSFANFSHTYENENEKEFGAASKASSLVSNALDTKNEFRRLMEQKYLPPSYKNILIFTFIAIILEAASFFSYGGLSNQMLSELSDGLFTTDLVENYKINILKLLVIQQNYLAFNKEDNFYELNISYYQLKDLGYQLKNPPLSGFSDDVLMIEVSNGTFQEISIIMGMDLYYESIEGTLNNDENIKYFIINNGLNLFTCVDGLFSFEGTMQDTLNKMRTNLIILVIISLGIMSFLMFSIITNMFFSHKFINSTLKLLCSISIKDYKTLYYGLFENNTENNIENSNFKMMIKKKKITSKNIASKENIVIDKTTNNNTKKKVRHHVVPLTFSKLNFLCLLLFFSLYASLFIINLNQSQLLDSSLANKLIRENFFNNLRIKFYHIFSVLNDHFLGYLKSPNNTNLIQNLIIDIGSDLDNVLNVESYYSGAEQIQYDNAINSNLCENDSLNNISDLLQQCPIIGAGVLTKGLYPGFMYLYSILKSVIDERSSLNIYKNNEEILNILRIVDLSAKQYFSSSIQSMANQLKNESIVLMIINSFMACGIFGISLCFLALVVKRYEERLIIAKKVLGLIPFNIISKSQKIRKYLNSTKKSNKL